MARRIRPNLVREWFRKRPGRRSGTSKNLSIFTIGNSTALAGALFAFLAWRAAHWQNKIATPYLTGHLEVGGTPRLQGANAEQWEIVSIRLLLPITATFLRQEGSGYDDNGIYQPGQLVNAGRILFGQPEHIMVSCHSSPLLLFKIALKSSPRSSRFRLVRQRMKP